MRGRTVQFVDQKVTKKLSPKPCSDPNYPMTKSYQHLTVDDRITIWHEHSKGLNYYTVIAERINKQRTTISWELRRNALENGDYVPTKAHQ